VSEFDKLLICIRQYTLDCQFACVHNVKKFALFGLGIKLLSFLIILYTELSTNVSWLAYFINTKSYKRYLEAAWLDDREGPFATSRSNHFLCNISGANFLYV